LKIQNGRRLSSLKNKKIAILPNRLMDFDEVWRGNAFGTYTPVWVLKIYYFEKPIWQMYL